MIWRLRSWEPSICFVHGGSYQTDPWLHNPELLGGFLSPQEECHLHTARNTFHCKKNQVALIPGIEFIPEWKTCFRRMWVFHCQTMETPITQCLLWVLVMVSEQTRWTKSFNKGFRILEKEGIPNNWDSYKTNPSKVKSVYRGRYPRNTHVKYVLFLPQRRGGRTCFPSFPLSYQWACLKLLLWSAL